MKKTYANLLPEIIRAKEKIESLREEDSLVFPVFTDLHSTGVEDERTKILCEALKQITNEIKCDMVVNLGDNTEMLGRNIHITNHELKRVLEDMLDAIYKSINCPLITVNGNHDAVGTDFFKPDFWNSIVKNKYGNTNAVYDTSGSYYYVDYEKSKTRFVVLSLPCESDLYSEYPTPVWAFGDKQIKWLADKALNTENNVILLMHVPFGYWYRGDESIQLDVWNGEKAAKSHIADLCGRIEDRAKALDVIKEFVSRPGSELVACMSGHIHVDSLWKPFEKRDDYVNYLPCYQTVTLRAFIPEGIHKEYGISIDVAVWTPSKSKFNLIRVGDGEDRELLYKERK